MQKALSLAGSAALVCCVLLPCFSECPASAKTMQEAMNEMQEAQQKSLQRSQSIIDSINRENQKTKDAFKSAEETNKAVLRSAGMTEYRHTELSNGRPIRTYEFNANAKPGGGAPAESPQSCFSKFLWALRSASSFSAVKNYLDETSSSCTLDSLRSTFGSVSQIEKCNVNGKTAILTVKTIAKKGGTGRVTVRMSSDGSYWRVTGI